MTEETGEEFNKKNFLEHYLQKQKELSRRQRQYKTVLSTKLRSRKETIVTQSYQNTIDQLRAEKDTLRAQIWVASGETFRRQNNRAIRNIQCHIACQEHLGDDIRHTKECISNLEREISRVNRQVYDLNRRTVPDSQHQAHVARVRKKLDILENQLEVGVRSECAFTAINSELRGELIMLLHHRTSFNDIYTKLAQRLNSDRKYIVDLIDYALGTFERCINAYEKMSILNKKDAKDHELRMVEMQAIMRRKAADAANYEFMDCKGHERIMDDLQPKEYQRRERFRQQHRKKINLYNDVLQKIFAYTNSKDVDAVLTKFQKEKGIYYSFFTYSNELSYHMTILNKSVNQLYNEVAELKFTNHNTLQNQLETIEKLEETLKTKQKKNEELREVRDQNDKRLEKLLQGIQLIRDESHTDCKSLDALLGDFSKINLFNMRDYLKILEKRIHSLMVAQFIRERQNPAKRQSEYIVRDVHKICEWATPIDDIVLTQQCPECGEADATNAEDADGEGILSMHTVLKKLYERVVQPEMQYRLHSISQCRMQKSRMLAAKRND
ncbi:outer dynein arm-docking complex subunit 1 [Anastrepha obliqua]|uniref:outer dynein arm-docking complex subunit 1 n=1 Tax=Anastrepha obliqua TaxID=95512 RepID=UPI0024090111|nr:outer dynein arm-docking complex subunit 1 [Anastrepha obliqua]